MNKTTVELREAGERFAELTPLVREGVVITLCDQNLPLAEIRPLPRPLNERRPFGLARGTLIVPEDFGQPDADIEEMFFGKRE
ncbi:MAG TPA: type II toxin-antitoxin system Phd/YefM family antitoxin [Verrucomicrobiota bacterium]|nr:prevent-host-death protein [Verrucomicrobiales bacterium]HRI16608.1 type II toxin-antitoxin system Phd/YefM family antitoxin [Verrucomicrobiota bacterium]